MKKAIVIESNGIVENIVIAGSDFDPGPGRTLLDAGDAQIGGVWDGTRFLPPPGPPLSEARAAALALIDASAETARQDFVTAGDWQLLSYEAKRREAERWAADAAPAPANYPWARSRAARLAGVAEDAVTTAQAQAVITEWAARADAWEAAGIAIEYVREGAREAVTTAADAAAIDAMLADLVWPSPV